MIELLFNAVWLAVVAAAFLLVPRRSSRATLGIACVLVLLFPIISVSDDLALDGNSLEEAMAIVVCMLLLVVALRSALSSSRVAQPAPRSAFILNGGRFPSIDCVHSGREMAASSRAGSPWAGTPGSRVPPFGGRRFCLRLDPRLRV